MSTSQYFEKVEAFLYDVQRVVTPRWLSRELGINLSLAKELLQDFYDSERSKARFKQITVVHVVSGVPKYGQDGSYEVSLAAGHKLAECEARFSEFTTEIYSLYPSELTVSPASSIINANCEHAVSSSEDYGRYDRIRSKACMDLRSKEQIEELRRLAFRSGESMGFSKQQPSAPAPQKTKASSAISSAFANASKKSTNSGPGRSSSDPAPQTKEVKKDEEQKPTVAADKKPSPVKSKQHEERKPIGAAAKKLSPVKAKQNSLTALFNRQAEKNKTAPPKPKEEKPVEVKEVKEKPVEVKKEQEKTQKRKQESDEESKKAKKPPPAKKRKTLSKKKEKPKLKRVVAMFSSSEDEESDEEAADKRLMRGKEELEEEEEVKPTPDLISSDDEDEVVPATPKMQQENLSRGGKHKVKKWVEKTFLDEDGFMVTQKVMEEVEVEDTEAEKQPEEEKPVVEKKPSLKAEVKVETDKENVKKDEEAAPKGRGRPKKAASVASGKQSSITSFFTKAK